MLVTKLFNLFINDICKVFKCSKYIFFPDKITVFFYGDDLHYLMDKMHNVMINLKLLIDKKQITINFFNILWPWWPLFDKRHLRNGEGSGERHAPNVFRAETQTQGHLL